MFLKLKSQWKNLPFKITFMKFDYENPINENNIIDIIEDKFCYQFEQNCIGISLKQPVFPYSRCEISLSEEQIDILRNSQYAAGLIQIDKQKISDNLINRFHPIGTYCSTQITGKNSIILNGLHRVLVEEVNFLNKVFLNDSFNLNTNNDIILQAAIQIVKEQPFEMTIQLEAKLKYLIDLYSKILYLNKNRMPVSNCNLHDAYNIVDSLGGYLIQTNFFESQIAYDAFQQMNIMNRVDCVIQMMNKQLIFTQNFSEIGKMAQKNIQQRQAQEFYNEIFKIVKYNTSGPSGKQGVIDKMNKNLVNKKVPIQVQNIFKEEVQKYMQNDEMSSEANVIRNYLEWLCSLPYGVKTQDQFDLKYAQKILDQNHYGIQQVKERILEFIAVAKLNQSIKGKILCLVGPPGTGKTSLSKSISIALNRNYYRISLGGESDINFLKGHRKTYIGAYPGKIIEALRQCQSENCVIVLDEIDKLGTKSEMFGDPQSMLLEILDPNQNSDFVDNYLDYPVDLSQVLFICSANMIDNLSSALVDRMDVIQLSSYTNEEKKEIYSKYLMPKISKQIYIPASKFKISENVLDSLIVNYCREPGIRQLVKYTKKIMEKIAYQIVSNKNNHHVIEVNQDNLTDFIGYPQYDQQKVYAETPSGVARGIAYTSLGGSLIFIEALQSSFNYSQFDLGLKATGSLGSVMKESVQIAYSFVKIFSHDRLQNDFLGLIRILSLEKYQVHVHAPEGAVHKDGPSAGITIASALISLIIDKPIKPNLAMTGELTLTGKVLKIGGVKEKILAAKRESIKELIFPAQNKNEVQQLQDYITQDIVFYFVENYNEVFDIIFE